ncbi:hypothetical protein F4559_003265 [Saccharothrix violaceirubra]|uniref:Uncharacterized protein n=1 Tax=Saccharothrix violaceirubra TaxID=413306 RepID=A0A7W7T401_9PSEU|nr:hypothetical protein [Saccharothrix violaceirubra]
MVFTVLELCVPQVVPVRVTSDVIPTGFGVVQRCLKWLPARASAAVWVSSRS